MQKLNMCYENKYKDKIRQIKQNTIINLFNKFYNLNLINDVESSVNVMPTIAKQFFTGKTSIIPDLLTVDIVSAGFVQMSV